MSKSIEMGEIVQANPDGGMFAGCLMVVTEVKPWGDE